MSPENGTGGSSEPYTHQDLARLIGVSVTTVKSYRKKFPGFLEPVANGKPLRFDGQTLGVCIEIRDGFAASLSVDDIRRRLSEKFKKVVGKSKLSISDDKGPDSSTVPLIGQDSRWEKIASSTETLAASLDAALRLRGGDEVRLGRLEALMADILGLLHGRHPRAAQPQQLHACPTPGPARRSGRSHDAGCWRGAAAGRAFRRRRTA